MHIIFSTSRGSLSEDSSLNDYYLAVSYTLRDRMQHLFVNSVEALLGTRIQNYLLPVGGISHGSALAQQTWSTLGLYDDFAQAAEESGLNLKEIIDHEEEPGPGQRRAGTDWPPVTSTRSPRCRFRPSVTVSATSSACSTRRSSTAGKRKSADRWLHPGNPWEIKKPDMACDVGFRRPLLKSTMDERGNRRDALDAGTGHYRHSLRHTGSRLQGKQRQSAAGLWSAEAPQLPLTLQTSTPGDYYGAVEEKIRAQKPSPRSSTQMTNSSRANELRLGTAVLLCFLFPPGHDPHSHLFTHNSLDNFS